MPLDIMSSFRKTSQLAFSSPTLNSILGSSLFVAVSISLLMLLLVLIMYPAKKNTSITIVCKMFLYMFFGTFLIVCLHDSILKYIYEDDETEKENDDFMRGTTLGGKDIIYNQSQMVSPDVQILGDAKEELSSQQPMPAKGAPISSEPVNQDDNSEVLTVVETGGGYLGGSKAPPSKPNIFYRR